MTPFERLGLFAGSALIAGAIAAATIFVSGWVGLAAAAGGAVIAAAVTLEQRPTFHPEEPEPTLETGELHVSTRAQVERRARRERDDDLDD